MRLQVTRRVLLSRLTLLLSSVFTPARAQFTPATSLPPSLEADSRATASRIVSSSLNPEGSGLEDAFQVNYFSNLNLADGVVNITNTGTSLGDANPYNGSAGNLCVYIYGYVPDEQLAACCSCNISPNSLHSFPLVFGPNALFSNPLTLAELHPRSVLVKLVATAGGSFSRCNNAARTAITGADLAPGLRAWGTHVHPTDSSTIAITEIPFERSDLSIGEAASLSSGCSVSVVTGGSGVCPGCLLGGLAEPAAKP